MSWSVFKSNMTDFLLNDTNATAAGNKSPEDMPAPFMVPIFDEEGNQIGEEFAPGDEGEDFELNKLAMKFAEEYHLAIVSAREGNRPIISGFHSATMQPLKLGIALTIKLALKRSQQKGDKPSMLLMLPVGLAVVAYWAVAMVPGVFSPLPPPAGFSSPIVGVTILFPGNPRPIAKGFIKAFSNYNEEKEYTVAVSKMLDDIIDGFKEHLDSISGIYFGISSSVPAVPLIKPWKGITV